MCHWFQFSHTAMKHELIRLYTVPNVNMPFHINSFAIVFINA